MKRAGEIFEETAREVMKDLKLILFKEDFKTLYKTIITSINKALDNTQDNILTTHPKLIGEYSDGYHTFNELYEFRKMYNAVLFNEWGKNYMSRIKSINNKEIVTLDLVLPKYDVHKSWRHSNGELCFGGGWFIVVAMLPTGMISNHYKAEDWELFKIPSEEKAKYEYDFHTSQDVIKRLGAL